MKTFHRYAKNAFRVTTNSDRDEGRGRTQILGIFDEVDALKAAKGQGLMGSDADVDPLRVHVFVPVEENGSEDWGAAFVVDVSWRYVKKSPLAEIRKSALKKLTDEEVEALGLSR